MDDSLDFGGYQPSIKPQQKPKPVNKTLNAKPIATNIPRRSNVNQSIVSLQHRDAVSNDTPVMKPATPPKASGSEYPWETPIQTTGASANNSDKLLPRRPVNDKPSVPSNKPVINSLDMLDDDLEELTL